ncbi:hypothetical protein S40288_03200 [Stachybotrys chartarum IBT 40288]|nr:hypothetical protein S40288_03200 [Stachybotrys chartarum IBT 40288]
MRFSLYLVAAAAVLASAQELDLISVLGQLPNCSVPCVTSAVVETSCGITDTNCICASQKFMDSARQCIVDSCSIPEAMVAATLEAEACNRPERSRKADLLSVLVIEIPASLAPWAHVYARWTSLHTFEIDDYLIIFAGIAFAILVSMAQWNGYRAFGVDTWTLDVDLMTSALKYFFALETIYLGLLCVIKVAIVCFYLRIFPQKTFQRLGYVAISFIVLSTTVILSCTIMQCRPISFTWEGWMSDERNDKCLDLTQLASTAAGFNILHDLIILILPLPYVYKLQVARRTKLGIMLMFSLGIFVLITSCVRLSYIISFGHTFNPAWDYIDPVIWSGLEVSVSLLVACLPAIRLLAKRSGVLKTIFGSTQGGAESRRTGSGFSSRLKSSRKDKSIASQSKGIYGSHRDGTNESQIELGPRKPDPRLSDVHTEVQAGSALKVDGQSLDKGIRRREEGQECERARVKAQEEKMADDQAKQRIIAHMNRDHQRELTHYLRHFTGLSARAAAGPSLRDISLHELTIEDAQRKQHKVVFDPPLASLRDARARLVAMDEAARQALDIGDVVVDRWTPPGLDLMGLFSASLYVYFAAGAVLPWTHPGAASWRLADVVTLGRAATFFWVVRKSFWVILALHLVEVAVFERVRLQRYGVERGTRAWALWVACLVIEGQAAWKRFDKLVEEKRKLKNH